VAYREEKQGATPKSVTQVIEGMSMGAPQFKMSDLYLSCGVYSESAMLRIAIFFYVSYKLFSTFSLKHNSWSNWNNWIAYSALKPLYGFEEVK